MDGQRDVSCQEAPTLRPSALSRSNLSSALLAGYPLVFASRPFRTLFVVLLLGGTAAGMALAYVSVWAADAFEIGPRAVGTLFVASGLTGAVANPLIGLLSDRLGWRRGLVIGQLAIAALAFLGYTQARSYEVAIGLVALSGLGILGIVLAMVNDLVRALPESERRSATRVLAAERTAWSIGIILGPAVAAGIVAVAGQIRPVFVAAALFQVAAIVAVLQVRPSESQTGGPNSPRDQSAGGVPIPIFALAALVAALVLVALPAQTRNMYLPLFVTSVLGVAPSLVGPLFTVTAVCAVAAMPYVGGFADRFGSERLLYAGCVVGAAYCALQTVAVTYVPTLAIQALLGFGIALWSTTSLIYLQQLLPTRTGVAGGIYVATQQFTPVPAGLLLGPLAESSGIPSAFVATAGLSFVALAPLVLAHGALKRASSATTEAAG